MLETILSIILITAMVALFISIAMYLYVRPKPKNVIPEEVHKMVSEFLETVKTFKPKPKIVYVQDPKDKKAKEMSEEYVDLKNTIDAVYEEAINGKPTSANKSK